MASAVAGLGRRCARLVHTAGGGEARHLGAGPPISGLDGGSVELVRRRLANAQRRGVPGHLRFRWTHDRAAAVLVLLCSVGGRVHVVFEERDRRLSTHGGEVCFAGGRCEPGESLQQAALRETFEETGLAPAAVRVVGELPPVPNRTHSLRVHALVGVADGEPRFQPNRAEVHRMVLLPLAHFYDPRVRRMVPFRSSLMRIPEYETDKPGLRIWGLTAFILDEFLRRIGSADNDSPA
ncbi:hypothetical protein H4R18_000418 [Coemansia javaensis]|uniref:Nudix hydrolase domain-containing protein n=1 Tax=Coemansia javaensis TaxID=2761396 RepID=A0A9W8LM53_9FUNG|nr:hypothetical protein H4R18_000418 [Coemansia javaensis]